MCCRIAIGPLHDPVTWYGINYAGSQVKQWDFQNKVKTWLDWYEFFCFGSLTALFASQHNSFRTIWKDCANSLFGVLVFVEGVKLGNPEKNPWGKSRTNNKLSPHMALGRNRTQATLVGGECSHYDPIPTPQNNMRLAWWESNVSTYKREYPGSIQPATNSTFGIIKRLVL